MDIDICRLCEKKSTLRISHIIPKFIYDWQKKTSATGKIRNTPKINKPVQDGLKLPWLCDQCENKISGFETYFAQNIFYSLINNSSTVNYEQKFLKVCVSISWRVLKYFVESGQISHYPEEIKLSIEKALSTWRSFILDERENPGEFEQHFFNFNGELSGRGITSPNIHRYLQRCVDINVIHNARVGLVYSKLPNFLLIGYVKCDSLSQWRVTRVCVNKGALKPCAYSFPAELFSFIESRASLIDKFQKSISDKQQDKINETYLKQSDQAMSSMTWQSLTRDIELFGEENVFQNKKNDLK